MPRKKTSKIDHDLIRELSNLLEETGLAEIEIEHEGLRVKVGRQLFASHGGVAPSSEIKMQNPAATPQEAEPKLEAPTEGEEIKSPMVGTVYLSAEPGAEHFVQVGSSVKKGQTLVIIEAMKTMNHIPAPRAGIVRKICVENEEPVEFGEPLVVLE